MGPVAEQRGQIERGGAAFVQANLALFAAGFATFAVIYCVQPLMPVFSAEFGVGAVASSLSLSLTTAPLAVAMLGASAVSESIGRKPVMLASILASAVLTVLAALVPHWDQLLAMRVLTGITVSGLPAVAMAYVSEEMHPRSVGLAMGLYVGGTGLGGMAGRLLTGVVSEHLGWRAAMATIGVLALGASILFWRGLPPSRSFQPRALRPAALASGFARHLRDRTLIGLFATGFVLLGSFVTVYNYVGYRLSQPPFGLSQSVIGAIFAVYLVGVASSAAMGELAGRLGRRKVLWVGPAVMLAGLALTLPDRLPLIVIGLALVTAGFFGGHSVASSWVGARARQARAQAASLYLFAYYMGSSCVGSFGGVFWTRHGWIGVAALDAAVLGAGLLVAVLLAGSVPLADRDASVEGDRS